MENTNILPQGVNVQISTKSIKITQFEVEKKLNMKSKEVKLELEKRTPWVRFYFRPEC